MAASPHFRTSIRILTEKGALWALHRGRGGFRSQQDRYGGAAARQTTCYSCGGFSHMSRDCTQGQKCYNCGEVSHLSHDCPQETSSERVRYHCKQPGPRVYHHSCCKPHSPS
jgi:hypothetical protein